MPDEVKKRGRPPLSPEEKEARRVAKNKRDNEARKQKGYPAQVKYRSEHYVVRIGLPMESKALLENILNSENMTISQMFGRLVYDKYGIKICEDIDDKK